MAYATAAELRTYSGIDSTAHDALLTLLIARAAATIDRYVGFSFEAATTTTRRFDSADLRNGGNVSGRALWLDGWLYSVTSITNGNGVAVAAASYYTEPRNAAPYYALTLKRSTSLVWEADSNDDTPNAISIVGRWAYSLTAPADITHATLRMALWYYRQRDSSTDMDRPMLAEGVTIMPSQLPKDVLDILDAYRWRGGRP